MSDLRYRFASIEDVDLLIDLRLEFAQSIHGHLAAEKARELRINLREYYNRTLPTGEYVSILCFENAELCGLGGMIVREQPGGMRNPTGRLGYIVNMYTREAFRRRGISYSVLERLVEHGKSLGLQVFELHATTEGAFVYRKLGFKERTDAAYILNIA